MPYCGKELSYVSPCIRLKLVYLNQMRARKTKTFRLDSAFLDELEVEAENQGISVNSLAERVLERYINHTRWVDRMDSVTIHSLTIKSVFDKLDDDQLFELGDSLGARVPHENFLMRGISVDDVLARYLVENVLGGYDHWFSVSYHDHSRPYFFIRSTNGDNWLLFVEAYLKAFYRENLGRDVECIRTYHSIQILL